MKLGDYGSFFFRGKDNNIYLLLYIKTNYLLKKHPNATMMDFDMNTKQFVRKPHTLNKIWFALFDKDNRDYPSTKDVTSSLIEKIINQNREFYDSNDYTAREMYDELKKSGLKPIFTKKWFEHRYSFIEDQETHLNKAT